MDESLVLCHVCMRLLFGVRTYGREMVQIFTTNLFKPVMFMNHAYLLCSAVHNIHFLSKTNFKVKPSIQDTEHNIALALSMALPAINIWLDEYRKAENT